MQFNKAGAFLLIVASFFCTPKRHFAPSSYFCDLNSIATGTQALTRKKTKLKAVLQNSKILIQRLIISVKRLRVPFLSKSRVQNRLVYA